MILYGLPTCSVCKAAQKALEAAGHKVSFRDIRMDPLSEVERDQLIAEFGSRIIDRTTPVWRGLSVWLREAEADAQLDAKPALMARPVVQDGTTFTLGWDADAQAVWGV
jgi:arsenate reductase-like glutaredoxin family protein